MGFTLVEIIVTIVIVAIMGAMLVTILGGSMIKSSEPIFRLQKSFALQQVMENITADYLKNTSPNLVDLQTAIGGGTTGGNEGATLPNNYGSYTIVDNHFIKFNASNVEVNINSNSNDPAYGRYLKVTIKNNNNETLTKIFIK